MRIYVFKRPNGSYWADYDAKFAQRQGEVVTNYDVSTQERASGVIAFPGSYAPDRVVALAQRAEKEHLGAPPPVVLAKLPNAVQDWSFWRRLKWLFTGK